MIRYFNTFALLLYAAGAVLCAAFLMRRGNTADQPAGMKEPSADGKPAGTERPSETKGPAGARVLIPALLIILAGAFLRFYALGGIPYGLNQDEASIGYDAWTLATSGIDRNGYSWPVYPITWGSGGGSPLMVYLAVLTTKLFGATVFSLRLTPAIAGVLTLVLFFFVVRMLLGDAAALAGTAFLAVCPWHIILSRWALDSNTLPFWLVLAILLFLKGERSGRTGTFLLSAAVFAVCLYAYGSATVTVPLFLLLICIYSIRHRRLTVKQMLLSMVIFLIVFAPLLVFYIVNYLDLPEMKILCFSVPKFTAARSVFYTPQQVLQNLPYNLKYLFGIFTRGTDEAEILCNYVPGFATLYEFTFPVTILGLAGHLRDLIRKKEYQEDAVFSLLILVSVLFTLFIEPDINRMTLIFIPLIYFHTRGLCMMMQAARLLEKEGRKRALPVLCAAVVLVMAAGFALFARAYYGPAYRELSAESFMPGYGDAVVYAESVREENGTAYSTYRHVAAPFMPALFYLQTPAEEFINTAVYRDNNEEFRVATSFGHWVFGIPEDMEELSEHPEDVLVIHKEEIPAYDGDLYEISQFHDFAVVRVKTPGLPR